VVHDHVLKEVPELRLTAAARGGRADGSGVRNTTPSFGRMFVNDADVQQRLFGPVNDPQRP
jgi:hypothetical protein